MPMGGNMGDVQGMRAVDEFDYACVYKIFYLFLEESLVRLCGVFETLDLHETK